MNGWRMGKSYERESGKNLSDTEKAEVIDSSDCWM